MNFVEEDKEEGDELEEEELEEEAMITRSKLPFSSLPSSSSTSTQYRNFMFQKQNLWLPSSSSSDQNQRDQHQQPPLNFNNKLEPIDLSLGSEITADSKNNTSAGGSSSIEKEHMFDKVVTPSDVGKLNRLVIPKQHAEKFFPLDSNSNEKGLLLNFEDRNGKPWRFRYSYWNSSQSYVMTKGWSRFVKEKKLDAGDIVSFQRGVGESARHNLYIDWRRRPSAPDPTSLTQFELQNQLQFPRWGRLYSLPQPFSRPPYDPQPHLHHNYSAQPYHRHYNFPANYGAAVSQQYYLRPPAAQFGGVLHPHRGDQDLTPMVIDSIPVVHGRSVGKRLRLFGVNMECSTAQDDQNQSSSSSDSMQIAGSFSHQHIMSSSFPLLQMGNSGEGSRLGGGAPISAEADSKKGKSSLSFDVDL